jgi:hypothetical protein
VGAGLVEVKARHGWGWGAGGTMILHFLFMMNAFDKDQRGWRSREKKKGSMIARRFSDSLGVVGSK